MGWFVVVFFIPTFSLPAYVTQYILRLFPKYPKDLCVKVVLDFLLLFLLSSALTALVVEGRLCLLRMVVEPFLCRSVYVFCTLIYEENFSPTLLFPVCLRTVHIVFSLTRFRSLLLLSFSFHSFNVETPVVIPLPFVRLSSMNFILSRFVGRVVSSLGRSRL